MIIRLETFILILRIFFMSMGTSYVHTHIYIEDMRTKKALSERRFLVKIANSNFMSTLRGFRWYPYFVAQEQLVAFEASKCRRS